VLSIAIGCEIYVIRQYKEKYQEEEDFKSNYWASVSGLNTETFFGRYWNPLTLIRWALTNLAMVFLRDFCVAQIFLLLATSVFFQMVLVNARPMTDKWDQRMTLMIEGSVSLYLYALLALTDFMGENTLRPELGWFLMVLTASVTGINVTLFVCRCLAWTRRFI